MAVTLFLGGGAGPGVAALPWLAVIWVLVKIFALIAVMIWLRGTLPRLRVDQLMGFAWKFLLPLSILNIFIAGSALHLLAGGRLAGLDEKQPILRQLMEGANPLVVAGLWIGALLILYVAANGLNQLSRTKVRPREYKYAE